MSGKRRAAALEHRAKGFVPVRRRAEKATTFLLPFSSDRSVRPVRPTQGKKSSLDASSAVHYPGNHLAISWDTKTGETACSLDLCGAVEKGGGEGVEMDVCRESPGSPPALFLLFSPERGMREREAPSKKPQSAQFLRQRPTIHSNRTKDRLAVVYCIWIMRISCSTPAY